MTDEGKMFEFIEMIGNHEQRKVARHEDGDLIIDTCAVNDSSQPFETGVLHPTYNNGKWVIVQLYDTKKEAEIGHQKWVEIMTANELPRSLQDVSSAGVAQLLDEISDTKWRQYDSATRRNTQQSIG